MNPEIIQERIQYIRSESTLAKLATDHLAHRYQSQDWSIVFQQCCLELGIEYHLEKVPYAIASSKYAPLVIFSEEGPLGHRKSKVFPYFSSEQAGINKITRHWMGLIAPGYLLPIYQ